MGEEGRALTTYTAKGELKKFIEEVASSLDMPPTGITLLGGNPYVNTAGLLYKTQKDERKVKSIRAEAIQRATEENGRRAIYKGIVEFQDGSSYENEGHASPESVKMRTLHNLDFLNMMAATRATNRAMRLATAVGLTSVEEMVEVADGVMVEVARATPAPKAVAPAPPAPQPSAEPEAERATPAKAPAPKARQTGPVAKEKYAEARKWLDDYASRVGYPTANVDKVWKEITATELTYEDLYAARDTILAFEREEE